MITMATISKEYHWCMGHQLMHHDGKCYRPHGHNYRAIVSITGPIDDHTGMVLDFYHLDKWCKPTIDFWDHQFMKNVADKRIVEGSIECPVEPTAENIAGILIDRIVENLGRKWRPVVHEIAVAIFETPKCSAHRVRKVRKIEEDHV